MSAIVVCVGGWLCAYGTMVDRQQTGWWDSTLRVIAHQILLSLPGDVDAMSSARPAFQLPEGADGGTIDDRLANHKPRFQVWLNGGREGFRSRVRRPSRSAPTSPPGSPTPRWPASAGASTA